MKRIMKFSFFLLLGLFLFSSCSSSDDDVQPQEFLLTPPNWLFGTWYQYYNDEVDSTPTFRFTEHKVEIAVDENHLMSVEDYLKLQRQINSDSKIDVIETENNNNTYVIKIMLNDKEYLDFVFNKMTDTTVSQCNQGVCKNLIKQ